MIVRPNVIDAVRLNDRTRMGEINPVRDVVRPWAQGTDLNSQVSLAAAGTGQDSITAQPEKGTTGDLEIVEFTSDHTCPYRAFMYVGGGTDKALMNVPIHVDMLCGMGAFPLYLPTSLFMEAKAALTIQYTNLGASTTNLVRLSAKGRRFLDYDWAMQKKELIRQFYGRNEQPFFLGLDKTSITLTSNQQGVRALLTVPGDADFEAEYLCLVSQGPVRIRINESTSSRPILTGGGGGASASQNGVQSTQIAGSAINPCRYFPTTGYWKRQTQIEVFFDNLLVGASNVVEMCFVGRLLYYPESPDRPQIAVAPSVAGGVPVPPQNGSQLPYGSGQPRYPPYTPPGGADAGAQAPPPPAGAGALGWLPAWLRG